MLRVGDRVTVAQSAFKVGDRVDHNGGYFTNYVVLDVVPCPIGDNTHVKVGASEFDTGVWYHSSWLSSKESRVLNILRQWKQGSR